MRRTIPEGTPDGLGKRLRDMERRLDDLERVRNPPPSYVEPAEVDAATCETEAFKASESQGTVASGSSGYLPFQWSSSGVGLFHSSSVTGLDDPPGGGTYAEVGVGGLWLVSLNMYVTTAAAPAAGDIRFYIAIASGLTTVQWSNRAILPWRSLAGQAATAHITEHFWLTSSAMRIRAYYENTLGITATISGGILSGSHVCDPASMTFVP